MANIQPYIDAINDAVYGEEVRGAIRDAIVAMNDDNNQVADETVAAVEEAVSANIKQFIEDYLNQTIDQEAVEQIVEDALSDLRNLLVNDGIINDSWIDIGNEIQLSLAPSPPVANINWSIEKKVFRHNPITRQAELNVIIGASSTTGSSINLSSDKSALGLYLAIKLNNSNLIGNGIDVICSKLKASANTDKIEQKLLYGFTKDLPGPDSYLNSDKPLQVYSLVCINDPAGTGGLGFNEYCINFEDIIQIRNTFGHILISGDATKPTTFNIYLNWTY